MSKPSGPVTFVQGSGADVFPDGFPFVVGMFGAVIWLFFLGFAFAHWWFGV